MPGGVNVEEFGALELPKLLFLARASETAERFEDMCEFMKVLVTKKLADKAGLTVEERNLLSVAYKNVVGALRGSWRALNEERENLELVTKYRQQVEKSLSSVCEEIIKILEKQLLPAAEEEGDVESQVFYLKMIGDYYRYYAEFDGNDSQHGKEAEKFYQRAYEKAKGTEDKDGLPPTHPIRLGLALNFSVCFYEILKDQKAACTLAQEAFDMALLAKFDELDQESYRDSALIMQLLRDNLSLWTKADEEEEDAGEADDEDAAGEAEPDTPKEESSDAPAEDAAGEDAD